MLELGAFLLSNSSNNEILSPKVRTPQSDAIQIWVTHMLFSFLLILMRTFFWASSLSLRSRRPRLEEGDAVSKNSYADKKRHRVDHASYNSIQDSLFLVQWNWSSPSRTILRATKIYPSSASHRASSLNLLKSWEEISITLIEKYRGSKIPLSESTNPTYRSKGHRNRDQRKWERKFIETSRRRPRERLEW